VLLAYSSSADPWSLQLNFLHRASSRACLILAWIHSGCYWWIIGMTGRHSLKTSVDMQWGVVATFGESHHCTPEEPSARADRDATLAAYTLLILGGLKHVRNAFYELFLLSHIALALCVSSQRRCPSLCDVIIADPPASGLSNPCSIYLVGCLLHWPSMGYWVIPGFVIWGFDRLARLVNTVVLNKLWLSLRPRSTNPACRATVKCIADNALELRIPRSLLRWQAGQHVYVMCPTISWLSSHPFTVASIPPAEKGRTPEVHLIIRECDGFTKNLGKIARAAGGETEILTCVEGPYGYVKSLDSYESVVLISGAFCGPFPVQVVRGLTTSFLPLQAAPASRTRSRSSPELSVTVPPASRSSGPSPSSGSSPTPIISRGSHPSWPSSSVPARPRSSSTSRSTSRGPSRLTYPFWPRRTRWTAAVVVALLAPQPRSRVRQHHRPQTRRTFSIRRLV